MELLISFLSDWGYIALFICMALENMNIPIPSEIILGFAGFLVSQQIFSFLAHHYHRYSRRYRRLSFILLHRAQRRTGIHAPSHS